jgi:hypothetical protein
LGELKAFGEFIEFVELTQFFELEETAGRSVFRIPNSAFRIYHNKLNELENSAVHSNP